MIKREDAANRALDENLVPTALDLTFEWRKNGERQWREPRTSLNFLGDNPDQSHVERQGEAHYVARRRAEAPDIKRSKHSRECNEGLGI